MPKRIKNDKPKVTERQIQNRIDKFNEGFNKLGEKISFIIFKTRNPQDNKQWDSVEIKSSLNFAMKSEVHNKIRQSLIDSVDFEIYYAIKQKMEKPCWIPKL